MLTHVAAFFKPVIDCGPGQDFHGIRTLRVKAVHGFRVKAVSDFFQMVDLNDLLPYGFRFPEMRELIHQILKRSTALCHDTGKFQGIRP